MAWTSTATSLKGPKGDKGADGAPGAAGAAGATGPTGPAGPTGARGPGVDYQGSFDNQRHYSVYDLVTYNGTVYVCTHEIASNTTSTPPSGSAFWDVFVPKGVKGDTGTTGAQGPQGLKGDTGSVGPAGADGQGYRYQGTWNAGVTYVAGDVVRYQGAVYSASAGFPPAIGVPPGSREWMQWVVDGATGPTGPAGTNGSNGTNGTFSNSYRGTWTSATPYAAGDLVTWLGSTWMALQSSTSRDPFPGSAYWTIVASKGTDGTNGTNGTNGSAGATGSTGPAGPAGSFNNSFRGLWASTTTYAIGDIVTYTGSSWIAISAGANNAPGGAIAQWQYVARVGDPGTPGAGLSWVGNWSANNAYSVNDSVFYAGGSFRRIVAGTTPAAPTNDTVNWTPVALAGAPGAFGAIETAAATAGSTTITTSAQTVATITLPMGRHLLVGTLDLNVTTASSQNIVGELTITPVTTGTAALQDGTAIRNAAVVSRLPATQSWVVEVTDPAGATATLSCRYTGAGTGVATFLATHSSLRALSATSQIVTQLLDSGARFWTTTVTTTGTGTQSVPVSFPGGLFTATPLVFVTPATSVPGSTVTGTGAGNVSTAGATIYVTRTNSTTTISYVLAVQLPVNGLTNGITDTGWQDINVSAGFAPISTAERPQVRMIGNQVHMRGGISPTGLSANGAFAIATLPTAVAAPLQNHIVAAGSSSGDAVASLFVQPNGVVALRTSSTLGTYYKFGTSYFTD